MLEDSYGSLEAQFQRRFTIQHCTITDNIRLEEPIEQNQQDYFIRHQSSQNEKGKHTP